MTLQPPYSGPAIAVIYLHIEPGKRLRVVQRPKTARQLLEALNILPETALVIRQEELLTPDRHIWPGEQIQVRLTGSRG